QLLLERAGFAQYRVQQAERLLAARPALAQVVAVAEQPFEDHLWIVLHRQRRRVALPRNRVAVGAAQAVAAADARTFDRELERRQRRVLTQLLRDDLVDRDAQVRLRTRLRFGAAQEGRRRTVVVRGRAAPIGERVL